MGGLIGECKGHHSSYSDAIEVEVLGMATGDEGQPLNIASGTLEPADSLEPSVPMSYRRRQLDALGKNGRRLRDHQAGKSGRFKGGRGRKFPVWRRFATRTICSTTEPSPL